MGYIVKGNFSASLCRDFRETVSNARVRIYQIEKRIDQSPEMAQDKKDLQILAKKEVLAKESSLIGKGKTDEDGNYEIELFEHCKDGPIMIDLKIDTVPGQKTTKKDPLQFTVRKLRPIWRNQNEHFEYCFNHHFSFEFWSHIRTLFDAWLICGHVKFSVEGQNPVIGATVSAFDTDWIQDDVLGEGVTDEGGYFRIDFNGSAFKQTFLSPAINIETPISVIPSPGVYFKITSTDGHVLYKEDRAEGRSEERKRIPHCYSIDLYLKDAKNKVNREFNS